MTLHYCLWYPFCSIIHRCIYVFQFKFVLCLKGIRYEILIAFVCCLSLFTFRKLTEEWRNIMTFLSNITLNLLSASFFSNKIIIFNYTYTTFSCKYILVFRGMAPYGRGLTPHMTGISSTLLWELQISFKLSTS